MFSRLTRVAPWLLPLACSAASPQAAPGPTVNMRFARASFYDAPFPSDDLVKADGTIAIAAFPNPSGVSLVDQAKALAGAAHGFSEAGAIYFTTTGAVKAGALPDLATSVTPRASVFLMGVQPGSPEYLHRVPVTVRFDADGGPFGAPDLLSLLPLQGQPLRPKTRYAAVVTTAIGVSPSDDMAAIAGGPGPRGISLAAAGEYRDALATLERAGTPRGEVAGLAVFTTDDPAALVKVVLDDAVANHLPAPDQPFTQTDLFPEFCVYASTLPMPDYQAGAPPYDFATSGGTWTFDASGKPLVQRTEEAGIVVTIPRQPMPPGGWPLAHFIRTGGGGSRPLVDRGPQAVNGGPALTPGTGPALWFARAGLAGASVDGPHENLRNLTNGNEDYVIFNVFNAPALRDNVRESGVEYALFAHVLSGLTLDVHDCPGTTSPARFDASRFALMGHSMGATIAPLSLAFEPLYEAVVLSGAGASWIENVMWKTQPMPVRGDIELFLGYTQQKRHLVEEDPVLTLFQWAEEPADSAVYARDVVAEPPAGIAPRHVLMEQGIVDHYIMPAIADGMSLSLGLDLAGTPLDASSPELQSDHSPTLESVLPYSGGTQLPLPVSGNRHAAGQVQTTVVAQHPSDGIEDGHEIVFQTDPPKREYRCFLQTWAAGQTPYVPVAGDPTAPCR